VSGPRYTFGELEGTVMFQIAGTSTERGRSVYIALSVTGSAWAARVTDTA